MSGEAVVVTAPVAAVNVAVPVVLTVAAFAGVGVVGVVLTRGVMQIVQRQVEAARERAEEERARIAEWQRFERRQAEAMEALKRRHEAVAALQRQLLAGGLDAGPAPPPPAGSGMPRAEGYRPRVDEGARDRAALATALGGLSEAIAALPREVLAYPDAPFERLRQQVALRLRELSLGQPLERAAFETLKRTVEDTTRSFLGRLAGEQSEREARRSRIQAALDRLLLLGRLAPEAEKELDPIRQALMRSADAGDLPAGELARAEQRLDAVDRRVAEALAKAALRPALAEAVLRHLGEMEYEVLTPFPGDLGDAPASARVGVPGGEQVAITLEPSGRLRFAFEHERVGAAAGPLTPEETAFAKAQERRWCSDLNALVSRLVKEGFASTITVDRKMAEARIPVVHWEPFEPEDDGAPARQPSRRRRRPAQRRGTGGAS